MAQLSQPDATVLTLAEAVAAIAASVLPLQDADAVALTRADGRVLVEAVVSPIDLPPFDNSAVDGYAVALADVAGCPALPVAGRIAAGGSAPALSPGTAARIFTGARLPLGADTVFMQEDVVLEHGRAKFPAGLVRGANTRRQGEDVARGAMALPAGRRLRPQDLALAAALGVDTLRVSRRPRVALFSTGDELVERGAEAGAAQRFDSNRVMLAALLARAGAVVTDLGIVPDDRAAIGTALAAAAPDHDLVLTSGGVSVGDGDHVKTAVAQHGALALWRLAVKPGRPLAFGRIGTTPFVGLPGNPVAAFVTFVRVLRPMLARMMGEDYAPGTLPAVAAFSHRKRPGLREYVRVSLRRDGTGGIVAEKPAIEGAAILTSLTESDGFVELPEPIATVAPGDVVDVLPYSSLW